MPLESRQYNRKNTSHRKWPETNLRKDLFEIMRLLFLHLWHLWFWRRIFSNNLLVLEDVGIRRFFKEFAVFTGFWHMYISRFLGYDFVYPGNTIFCSKTKSKEVIEH
jgi:hypothetical protein